MEDFLRSLLETQRAAQELAPMTGRSFGLTLGRVTDREDPEEYGRIKVAIPTKGDRYETDWLWHLVPLGQTSLPVPKVGDTVAVYFRDGDTHQGYYCSVLNNKINPQGELDDMTIRIDGNLKIQVGDVTIRVTPDGQLAITGLTDAYLNQPDKQILTIGSIDTDSDISVTKGWT